MAVCSMVKALWAFFLLGVALFFFYDVLRFWRSVWGSRRATFLADVLWWLVAAFSCYTLFLAYTDGVIRALCLVVCGGGFACGYFTLGTLTGHLWARLGKRLAGKRNNRRKKRKIQKEKEKKLLQSPYNILYNKLNARKRKRKRKRHLAATRRNKEVLSMIQNLKNSMKRSKYLRLLLVVPMVVLFLYCSVTLVNQSADISRMQKQKQTLTAQLASVQQENARLEEVVGADNKDDYIEQKAREKGYVKGDEIVFYDISGTE